MKYHPQHDDFLVELSDLDANPVPEKIRDSLEPLGAIADWARNYLSAPHPELGREGPVCPYVPYSMRHGLFFLTVVRGTPDLAEVEEKLLRLRDWFREIEPREGQKAIFKTILCLFPDVAKEDYPRLIDAVQESLRPVFVEEGLMVGEFHDAPPNKGGLWNEDFRPLNSPVPMLVIRHMVPVDFSFLKEEKDLLSVFLGRFGDKIPAHLREEMAVYCRRYGLPFTDPKGLTAVHPRVSAALLQHGVQVSVYRHQDLPQPIRSPQDFAATLGYDVSRITKSLFLRSRANRYVVAVCAADSQLDLKRLAKAVGEARLELATTEELAALLEFSPGGVSPIAVDSEIPVFIDEELVFQPTILVAAGEVAVEIEIDPTRLVEMTGATILQMTQRESPVTVESCA